nr:hypothetical protein [uncultured Bacillus sp.]
MQLRELAAKINESVENLDLVTTRKYIEENLELLSKRKALLNSNARSLLDFLLDQKKSGVDPLSRKELAVINSINVYAYKFDLRGIKVMLKENSKIFLRNDTVSYLNKDAKIILEGMGVIGEEPKETK